MVLRDVLDVKLIGDQGEWETASVYKLSFIRNSIVLQARHVLSLEVSVIDHEHGSTL